MAHCPNCENKIKWIDIFSLGKSDFIKCHHCHKELSLNTERSNILLGIIFIPFLLLYLPYFGTEDSEYFLVFIVLFGIVLWSIYTKLDLVPEDKSTLSPEAALTYSHFIRKRVIFSRSMRFVSYSGMLLFIAYFFIYVGYLDNEPGDITPSIFLIFGVIPLILKSFSLCPKCKKITSNDNDTIFHCKKCHTRFLLNTIDETTR